MLEEGSEIHSCAAGSGETTNGTDFPVEYAGLSAELKTGDPILLADGLIRLTVLSTEGKAGASVRCRVEDGGPIGSRKGVNVPGTLVALLVGPKTRQLSNMLLKTGPITSPWYMFVPLRICCRPRKRFGRRPCTSRPCKSRPPGGLGQP